MYSSFPQAGQEHAPLEVQSLEADLPQAFLEIEATAREDGFLDVRIVKDRQLEVASEVWIPHGGQVFLPQDSLFTQVKITDDGLAATISEGPLATPLPYRLLRVQ